MDSLSTIRRRAKNIGFQVEKGYVHFNGEIYYNADGKRETGYMVRELITGSIMGGFDNMSVCWSYTWGLENVVNFLKGVYAEPGMAW